MIKISDFKLAEYFLRHFCKNNGFPFVDLEIEFVKDKGGIFQNSKLIIGEMDKWNKTIFHIVSTYLHNIQNITGYGSEIESREKTNFYNFVISILRDISYSREQSIHAAEPIVGRLNRNYAVWSIMKNIICPIFEKPLVNTKIVYGKSSLVDGAKFLTHKDILNDNDENFPFVFSNLFIENKPVREAFLLYEVIRSHEMDPRGVIHDIFTKQEIWGKFLSFLRIAYLDRNEVNDFLTTLSILADEMGSINKRLIKANKKWYKSKIEADYEPQYTSNNSTWHYLGLIEKLLEPARGADWSTYNITKPITDELWTKVEIEKKKRGLKELPFELLLRVQSEEFKQQPDLIIQGLLADNRVW